MQQLLDTYSTKRAQELSHILYTEECNITLLNADKQEFQSYNPDTIRHIADVLTGMDVEFTRSGGHIICTSNALGEWIRYIIQAYKSYADMTCVIDDVKEAYPNSGARIVAYPKRGCLKIEDARDTNYGSEWNYLNALLIARNLYPRCYHPLATAVNEREHKMRKEIEGTETHHQYRVTTYKCIPFSLLVGIKKGAYEIRQMRQDGENAQILLPLLPQDCTNIIASFLSCSSLLDIHE